MTTDETPLQVDERFEQLAEAAKIEVENALRELMPGLRQHRLDESSDRPLSRADIERLHDAAMARQYCLADPPRPRRCPRPSG